MSILDKYLRAGLSSNDIADVLLRGGFLQSAKHRPDGSLEIDLSEEAFKGLDGALSKKLGKKTLHVEEMGNVEDFWQPSALFEMTEGEEVDAEMDESEIAEEVDSVF